METKQVTFSNGKNVDVRKLRIFELDEIPAPSIKPYTYTIHFGQTQIEEVYELHLWKQPPPQPVLPLEEVAERSPEWFAWREYHLYYAAINHRVKQKQEIAEYKNKIKNYIFENCLDEDDRDNIVNKTDWLTLCQAALIPEVSLDDLEKVGLDSFQARYGSQSLLSLFLQLSSNDDGLPEDPDVFVNYLKQWEIGAMLELGMQESDWQELSIPERARKIFALNLPRWQDYINYRLKETKEGKKI